MMTPMRILLLGLALLALCLQPLIGEDNGGGNGGQGITILPGSGGKPPERGSSPRASFEFPAGADIRLRLPSSMTDVIAIIELEGGSVGAAVAYICKDILRLDGAELRELHAAGVAEFGIRLVAADLQVLYLRVLFSPAGDVTINVY